MQGHKLKPQRRGVGWWPECECGWTIKATSPTKGGIIPAHEAHVRAIASQNLSVIKDSNTPVRLTVADVTEGMVVRLISGGPPMTVREVIRGRAATKKAKAVADSVICVYFTGAKQQGRWYPELQHNHFFIFELNKA